MRKPKKLYDVLAIRGRQVYVALDQNVSREKADEIAAAPRFQVDGCRIIVADAGKYLCGDNLDDDEEEE